MIVLGRLAAPYGVQGWLKVHAFGDDPVAWAAMPQWWLGSNADSLDAADWKPYALRGCREYGKGVVVAFRDVPDRNGAEALEGLYIAAPREALPQPGKDEFYWGDLIGLSVVNSHEVVLGQVDSLIETGAHSVLCVKEGKTERLIPFVEAFVKTVDVPARRITVEWEADW